VLDRIEVDVIDMALEVALAADGMLPEATLPKSALAISMAQDANARARHGVGESALDQAQPI
jgi:hypothetical protein